MSSMTKSLLLLLFVNSFQNPVVSYTWTKATDGNLPKEYFGYFPPNTHDSIQFCRVHDNVNKQTFTGTISNGEKSCDYIYFQDGEQVRGSNVYEVLTSSKNENLSWVWSYADEIPANAIPCTDHQLGDQCYLGVSLYSDGICHEGIGKINSEKGLIFMSKNHQEVKLCPFYMYLTSTVTLHSENIVV